MLKNAKFANSSEHQNCKTKKIVCYKNHKKDLKIANKLTGMNLLPFNICVVYYIKAAIYLSVSERDWFLPPL